MLSWRRSGSVLHPHFMFCMMLLVFCSDFMIRGYDDPNLDLIPLANLYGYQLATLAMLIGLGVATAAIRKPYELDFRRGVTRLGTTGNRTNTLILTAGGVLLALEIIKRLSVTGWSLGEVIDQMMGPRGQRDWDVEGVYGRNNAIFQLLSAMIPVAGITFGYALFWGRAAHKFVAAIFYGICMFILVTDGSRTPSVIALASLALFGMSRFRSAMSRVMLIGAVALSIAASTSLQYMNRSGGYRHSDFDAYQYGLRYHQDDSIYRVWSAYAYADYGVYYWDPSVFFGYIIASPVPRVLWPNKPLLDQDFYGEYKLYYTTTTFLGEWVAMFGSTGGTIAAFIFGFALYRGFYGSQKLMRLPLGFIAYLLIALYVYMVMRSMPNLTSFIFAPGAVLLLIWVTQMLGRSERRALSAAPVR